MTRKRKRYLSIFVATIIASLTAFFTMSSRKEESIDTVSNLRKEPKQKSKTELVSFVDSVRLREIPYAIYHPTVGKKSQNEIQLIVFSHGYGSNYPKNYVNYSYLTKFLAQKGYWVLSIQHELKTDSLLPQTGNIFESRMPFWKRGEENILAVLNHFSTLHPALNIRSIDLIGHSNGGDMSILTAINHPNLIRSVITLDHLRMPIPLVQNPVYSSLRATDKKADEGVLPNEESAEKWGIRLIPLRNITHNQLNDEGSKKQKNQVNTLILRLLSRFD